MQIAGSLSYRWKSRLPCHISIWNSIILSILEILMCNRDIYWVLLVLRGYGELEGDFLNQLGPYLSLMPLHIPLKFEKFALFRYLNF